MKFTTIVKYPAKFINVQSCSFDISLNTVSHASKSESIMTHEAYDGVRLVLMTISLPSRRVWH